jgi:Tfp pilus assembly protein PilF
MASGSSLRCRCGGLILCLAAGCSLTQPNRAPISELGVTEAQRDADQLLQTGLKQYDRGQYKRAATTLQQALDTGLTPPNQALAYKHLAFISCTSNNESRCRNEFRKVLELEPRFDLAPAEAGHPQWGPVFRSVKANSK